MRKYSTFFKKSLVFALMIVILLSTFAVPGIAYVLSQYDQPDETPAITSEGNEEEAGAASSDDAEAPGIASAGYMGIMPLGGAGVPAGGNFVAYEEWPAGQLAGIVSIPEAGPRTFPTNGSPSTQTVVQRPGFSVNRWEVTYVPRNNQAQPLPEVIIDRLNESSRPAPRMNYTVDPFIITQAPSFQTNPVLRIFFVRTRINMNHHTNEDFVGYNWEAHIEPLTVNNLAFAEFDDLTFAPLKLTLSNNFRFIVECPNTSDLLPFTHVYTGIIEGSTITSFETPTGIPFTNLEVAPIGGLPIGVYNATIVATCETRGGTPATVGTFGVYTFTVRRLYEPEIEKTASPSSVTRNSTVTYTLTIDTDGMSRAAFEDLIAEDVLDARLLNPRNFAITGASAFEHAFDPATRTLKFYDMVLQSTAGVYANTVVITFDVTVAADAPAGVIPNVAELRGAEGQHPNHDPNVPNCPYDGVVYRPLLDDCDADVTVVLPTITKTANPAIPLTVARGGTVTYTLTINPNGLSSAAFRNLAVVDTLHPMLTFAGNINVTGATAWEHDLTGNKLTFYNIELANNVSAVVITFDVTVAANAPAGVIPNVAELFGPKGPHPDHDPTDPNCPYDGIDDYRPLLDDCDANVTVEVPPTHAPTITKTATPATPLTVVRGGTVRYTLTINTDGMSRADFQRLIIEDRLDSRLINPRNFAITGANNNFGSNFNQATRMLTFSNIVLNNINGVYAGTVVITFNVTVASNAPAGTIPNVAVLRGPAGYHPNRDPNNPNCPYNAQHGNTYRPELDRDNANVRVIVNNPPPPPGGSTGGGSSGGSSSDRDSSHRDAPQRPTTSTIVVAGVPPATNTPVNDGGSPNVNFNPPTGL